MRAVGRRAAEPRRPADASRRPSASPRFASATPSRTPRRRRCSTERRAPAPISGPAAAIAAAALREPRLGDVEATIAERERLRAALSTAGYDCPPAAANFVFVRTDEPLAERLEAQGIVVRSFAEGIRATVRRPSENDVLLRALGAEPGEPRRP